MICIGKGIDTDIPGLIPGDPFNVHQKAQQLGDGYSRMGIIQLNGNLVGKPIKTGIPLLVASENILQGGSHKEILLPQS